MSFNEKNKLAKGKLTFAIFAAFFWRKRLKRDSNVLSLAPWTLRQHEYDCFHDNVAGIFTHENAIKTAHVNATLDNKRKI